MLPAQPVLAKEVVGLAPRLHHVPVPTCEEVASIADSVDRAARAHELIGGKTSRPGQLRELRASALRTAIGEGRDATELATRLGVRAADIAWMTSLEKPTWPVRATTR